MNTLYRSLKNNKVGKQIKNIFPDIIIWGIIIFLFVFTVDWNEETLREDVKEVFINFIPYVFSIYVNIMIFKYFLLKKKYLLFALLSILSYTLFYYIISWVRVRYLPLRNDDIIFSIFLYSFMYIGFRYLITAPRQIFELKEAEAKRIKAERDLQEMEARSSQAELEVLKSQVNPHFLFNSLNNIYSLTMIDPKMAGKAILTLSDLMRYNLESSKKKYVSLNHEVEFIDNYIQLESLRVDDICKISYVTDGKFEYKAIAPLILISFVENCFKHGISSDESQNYINITIQLNHNRLTFKTENRIAAPRVDINKKDIKIGIENIKRRLELLYRNKYNLNINSDNGIFSVNLTIEL